MQSFVPSQIFFLVNTIFMITTIIDKFFFVEHLLLNTLLKAACGAGDTPS